MDERAEGIVAFWQEAGPKRWYVKDEGFDREISERFGSLVEDAAAGKLESWREAAQSALALLILLDQFPRNIYRGTPQAFASDSYASKVADAAIANGFNEQVDGALSQFFYMPFMHAEDLALQERCIALCEAAGHTNNVGYAKDHADIIRRFGRFPHRNEVLGRASTPEEIAFLKGGGFAG